ncbi:MAG: AAA family ATPase [Bacteroidales bacterium]|nr:AAA family ATPase [Bacteroidales bacterium]
MAITREKRWEIYQAIKALGDIWGHIFSPERRDRMNQVDFLDRIWDLRLMSSSDPRFNTAAEDARKHLIDNDDWDDDYVFLDRFKLLECKEEEFLKFLNVVISPDVRKDESEIEQYIAVIEKLLPTEYDIIGITDSDGQIIHSVVSAQMYEDNEIDQYPINIVPNAIPFFTDIKPTIYPAFQLLSDSWDDFGFKTTFHLFLYDREDQWKKIGDLKILNEEKSYTKGTLPDSFTSLSAAFCSLGQSDIYYKRLKSVLPKRYQSVLYALKDAAWFSNIQYRFENRSGFKNSLLRDSDAIVILSSIKRKIERGEIENSWNFGFHTAVPYSEQPFDLKFDFGDLEYEGNTNRIKALIGPNGAGKTSILKNLVRGLIRNEEDVFQPSRPVFSKVIAISFSIFDTFIDLRGKSVLTYTYCGLHDNENTIMSVDDREARLKEALIWINGGAEGAYQVKNHIVEKFLKALEIVFPHDWIDSIYSENTGLYISAIIKKYETMSTGESMILNLIASLYANIRDNSLIVFDEIEVHLHPKAIRQMMSLLFNITKEFNSACILATHSSIVVQELLADNVTIIEKTNDGTPASRILNHESLAENLSVISNEIFGESSIYPHYKDLIKAMAEESETFEDLLQKLSSKLLPPSLPLYMLARNEFETR